MTRGAAIAGWGSALPETVVTTAEVGRVEVLKTESKGRANKRVRLAVTDPL